MSEQVVTIVSGRVEPDREAELIAGFEALAAFARPEGLIRSELQNGSDGTWRIETLWRDLDTLRELRLRGEPPAALALFERVGAEHSHRFMTVKARLEA
jgi:hypothetical protein